MLSILQEVFYLYVFGDVLPLCSRDVCLCVGSRLEPEGDQPADEDDSGLKEALLGTVQRFAAILLPAHHAVVGLRTHRGHICRDRVFIHVGVRTKRLTQHVPKSNWTDNMQRILDVKTGCD